MIELKRTSQPLNIFLNPNLQFKVELFWAVNSGQIKQKCFFGFNKFVLCHMDKTKMEKKHNLKPSKFEFDYI
ncbi:hypothetical protein BpHYR1_044365 [Brachionus plicatilis]|uniref:Uncharacterized protein n=1 Tax=Brachionus plicatilis TaxID=10195 RepID=A0A3M7ST38_BRAPC|nr:hypothetical protein BpHYR1_044365 [Brachionus plicatilis]